MNISWWQQPRALWVPLAVAGLWLSLTALFPTQWYDDVCHRLTMHTLVQHGHSGFPTRLSVWRDGLSVEQYISNSQFVTVGPAVHYPATLGGWSLALGRWPLVLMAMGTLAALMGLTHSIASPGRAFWAGLIVAGSLQFVTYGAHYLGEVPLLGYTLVAFLGLQGLLASKPRQWVWGLLLVGGTYGALLSKAYIGLPLGLVWLGVFSWQVCKNRVKSAFWLAIAGLGLPASLLLNLVARTGSYEGAIAYLEAASSYQSEFLAFTFSDSLRFLAFKPLIVLGTVALALRALFQRQAIWVAIAGFQILLTFLFLLSAGYDRFGLLLLPLSAIGISDWVVFLIRRVSPVWEPPRPLRVSVVVCLLLGLAWQKTPWELPRRAYIAYAASTRAVPETPELAQNCPIALFTFDLQLIPALQPLLGDSVVQIALPQHPPCGAALQTDVPQGYCLLDGIYAQTEYAQVWNPSEWSTADSVAGDIKIRKRRGIN